MKIHCLQHAPSEGAGSIDDWARRRSQTLEVRRVFLGEPLPGIQDVRLLIVLDGQMGVHDEAQYPWLTAEKRFIDCVITAGKHVLGVCLGAHLVAEVLGAQVRVNPEREIGWFAVEKTARACESRLFAEFPQQTLAFHWHGDTFDIPAAALHVARSAGWANQAFV
jgi:GMP synthase-like glutamine amidotransferase